MYGRGARYHCIRPETAAARAGGTPLLHLSLETL